MARLRTIVLAASALVAASLVGAQTPHYHVVKTIPLGRARADYIIVDPWVRLSAREIELEPEEVEYFTLGAEEYEAEVFFLQFWPDRPGERRDRDD